FCGEDLSVYRAWRGVPCPANGLPGHGTGFHVRQTDYPGMARGSMSGKRITRAWCGIPCPADGLPGDGAELHVRQTGYPGMARGSMPGKRITRAWRGVPCPADGLSGHGAELHVRQTDYSHMAQRFLQLYLKIAAIVINLAGIMTSLCYVAGLLHLTEKGETYVEFVSQPILICFVIGYGIFMLILGVVYSNKISTSEDFILAVNSLGPIVLMGTLLATWVGSGSVTGGQNSLAYSFGIWPALMSTVPSLIGIGTIYLISSKIKHYGKYTVAEILEVKYGRWASVLAALIIILAFVGIVSYQFQGLGFILNIST